jgi:hypothetical protein
MIREQILSAGVLARLGRLKVKRRKSKANEFFIDLVDSQFSRGKPGERLCVTLLKASIADLKKFIRHGVFGKEDFALEGAKKCH